MLSSLNAYMKYLICIKAVSTIGFLPLNQTHFSRKYGKYEKLLFVFAGKYLAILEPRYEDITRRVLTAAKYWLSKGKIAR